jgi:hypothetical protein
VYNLWDFSKLEQKEPDDKVVLKMEVSKLIKNVSSSAHEYLFEIKDAYTFAEVQNTTLGTTLNLKTHLMMSQFRCLGVAQACFGKLLIWV